MTCGLSPTNVITGAVVSTTLTVRVTVLAGLPCKSDTSYVITYTPTTFVLTGLVTMIELRQVTVDQIDCGGARIDVRRADLDGRGLAPIRVTSGARGVDDVDGAGDLDGGVQAGVGHVVGHRVDTDEVASTGSTVTIAPVRSPSPMSEAVAPAST